MNARSPAFRLAFLVLIVAFDVLADDTAVALRRAREAFQEADFDTAAKAYQVAIDAGHLAPNELAEAFVGVGIDAAARASGGSGTNGKRAVDAFRLAVVVDPAVPYPLGGPKKPKPMLELARREMSKRTGDWFRVAFSERSIALGSTAAVARVRTDAVAGLEGIEVEARVGEGDPWVQRYALAPETVVVLPQAAHTTGRVRVRIAAIDDVGNRWAEVVRTVDVDRVAAPNVALLRDDAPAAKSNTAPPVAPSTRAASGFWASPWPWAGLGVVVLGFGSAYAFAALDNSGPVRVGAPTVHVTP